MGSCFPVARNFKKVLLNHSGNSFLLGRTQFLKVLLKAWSLFDTVKDEFFKLPEGIFLVVLFTLFFIFLFSVFLALFLLPVFFVVLLGLFLFPVFLLLVVFSIFYICCVFFTILIIF